jgi:hypothetical protein
MDFWCNQLGAIFKPISTSTNDMDLQCESMEQVENGYHIETKIGIDKKNLAKIIKILYPI